MRETTSSSADSVLPDGRLPVVAPKLAVDTDDKIAGIGYMLLAIASFALMDAIGKWVSSGHSVLLMLAVRSTAATLVLLAMLPFAGGRSAITTRQPIAQAVRCLFGLAAFLFFFSALRYLPLADATAIAFGGPLFLAALSRPVLGERVGPRRWLAIAVGFVGMLLIVRPSGAGIRPAALLAIAGSLSYALMMVLTRRMTRGDKATEPSFAFVFYGLAGQTLIGWLLAIWELETPRPAAIALMALMGLFALGGHFAITLAFRKAPVAVIAPFEYSGLFWAVLLGFFVFGELPTPSVWLGVAIIIGAGCYTLLREGR